MTRELLHLEYLEQHPDGYRWYTQFCECYRRWLQRRRLTMRQIHHAGDKCFVDYAGTKPASSTRPPALSSRSSLFVAVLGASNYTHAEATRKPLVEALAKVRACKARPARVTDSAPAALATPRP